jgi:hypothetical protein
MHRCDQIVIPLLALLAGLGLTERPANAADVFDFKGSITDVGIQRGPGQVGGVEFRIHGKFVVDHPLDLSTATVVLEQLFVDSGPTGLGELMTTTDDAPVVPLLLDSRENELTKGVFDQPRAYRPHIRLQIQNRDGAFEFTLKLDRGLMRIRPRVCEENTDESSLPLVEITHGMIIDDGVNPPVEVVTTQPWECTKPGRYHMRSDGSEDQNPSPSPRPTRTPTPVPIATPTPGLPTATPRPTSPPSSGNDSPTASLRQNQHGSAAGSVELDGRESFDRDGTIARYRFESGDGRVQDGPEPIARFVYPPGDFRASLTVFDDDGAASKPVSRGFSVR